MWLTVPQLAGLLNITPQAVRKAIAERRYSTARYRESTERGGAGGKVWQVSALDPAVPDEVREILGLKGDRWTRVREAQEAEKVGIAPERLDKKTAKRLRVLKRAAECPEGIPVGEWYARIAADEHVSVPTIYRWLTERKKGKVVSDRAPHLRGSLLLVRPAGGGGEEPHLRTPSSGIWPITSDSASQYGRQARLP